MEIWKCKISLILLYLPHILMDCTKNFLYHYQIHFLPEIFLLERYFLESKKETLGEHFGLERIYVLANNLDIPGNIPRIFPRE